MEKDGIYKCTICGNVVEAIEPNVGELVCCGKPMDLQKEKTEEQGTEKHLPIITIKENKITVKIGSIEHPMEKEHYIELIELLQNGKVIFSKRLYPGEKPIAEFILENTEGITAREYCNIHGLWKTN